MANTRAALLLVDIQPDFMPGGALAVADGDAIVEPVRQLMASSRFVLQAATQDWHPAGHASFASSHPGHQAMDTIELHGHPQILWPDHCVQGSAGAELYHDLPWEKVAVVVRKGMDPSTDSYSGFRNNWNADGERPATGLAGYLREQAISDIYVCGLARDFCVKWTAEDAADAGFKVHFVWDATRAVVPDDDAKVKEEVQRHGIAIVTAEQIC